MGRIWQAIRALLFYTGLVVLVLVMSLSVCLVVFFPVGFRQRWLTYGNKLIMVWLRITCGVKVAVMGIENIPKEPCVVLSNHQSTWETFFLQHLFVPASVMGTRFLPATKANPKEMLPVVDKPLIQYAVEEAIDAGITEMIFVTGRNKRSIADHFDQRRAAAGQNRVRSTTEAYFSKLISTFLCRLVPALFSILVFRRGLFASSGASHHQCLDVKALTQYWLATDPFYCRNRSAYPDTRMLILALQAAGFELRRSAEIRRQRPALTGPNVGKFAG